MKSTNSPRSLCPEINSGSSGRVSRMKELSLWRRVSSSGGRFFVLSIAFHLLLIGGACIWVVQSSAKQRKLNFSGATKPAPSVPEVSHEYKVQQDRRDQTAPQLSPVKITTTFEGAKMAIPELALAPASTAVMASAIGGMTGVTGAMNAATAKGVMNSGASGAQTNAGLNIFGFRGAGTLKGLPGRLYDLKQSRERVVTEANSNNSSLKILKKFEEKGYDRSVLESFFVAPDELTASRFWIPSIPASTMAKCFNVEKDVRPNCLVLHYKAKIVPPKEGTYRFVGFGDDFLGIKCDGKLILPFDRKGSRVYLRGEKAGALYEVTKRGHAVSDPIRLSKNQSCDFEVVLSKWSGGLTGFSLLVEREEDLAKYKRTSEGYPIIPIFETDISAPIPEDAGRPGMPTVLPEYDPVRLVWKVLKN